MLKQFAKAGVWVFAANVAIKGINFFLLPLYTKYLTPGDYGVIDLLSSFESLLVGLLIAGLDTALMIYAGEEENRNKRLDIAKTIFILNLGFGLVGLILISLSSFLGDVLFNGPKYTFPVLITLIRITLLVWSGIQVAWLRIDRKFKTFAGVQVLVSTLQIGFSVFFVAFLHYGFLGIIYGNLIAAIIIYVVNLKVVLICWTKGTFQKGMIRDILKFSLPLVPGAISSWILLLSDRYIILKYMGGSNVGLYGMAIRFTLPIGVLISTFQSIFPSFVYNQKEDKNQHKKEYLRLLNLFIGAFGPFTILYSLWAPIILKGVLPENFWPAAHPIYLLTISLFFQGGCYFTGAGMSLAKKSKVSIKISWVSALMNIGLNLIIVPFSGPYGAALSTFICTVFIYYSQWYYSEKFYPFSPNYKSISTKLLLLFILGFVGDLSIYYLSFTRQIFIIIFLNIIVIYLSVKWLPQEYYYLMNKIKERIKTLDIFQTNK